jgi:hypothetical protein
VAVAAGAAASAIIDLTKEFDPLIRQVEQLTGRSGDGLSDLTGQIKAVADTFDKDFNEILKIANTTSNAFGISIDDALNKISDGFIAGADASNEYISILREYPVQLKAVGLSFDEANSLILQQTQLGIFDDKGIDAIKEAGLRLRELTVPTRAALEGIGLVSDDIQKGLTDGTLSLFDVIQQVSARLGGLEADSPAVGAALADIFAGPGEDAGLDYILTLADVNKGVNELSNLSEKSTKRIRAELDATTELNQAKAELAQRFQDIVADGGNFISNVQTALIDGFIIFLDAIKPLTTALGDLFNLFRSGQDDIQDTADKTSIFSDLLKVALVPVRVSVGLISTLIDIVVLAGNAILDLASRNEILGNVVRALTLPFRTLIDLLANTEANIRGFKAVFDLAISDTERLANRAVINLKILGLEIKNFFSFSDEAENQIAELKKQDASLADAGQALGEAFSNAYNQAIEEGIDDVDIVPGAVGVDPKTVAARKKKEAEAQAAALAEAENEKKKREKQAAAAEKAAREREAREAADLKKQLDAQKEAIEARIALEELAIIRIDQARREGLADSDALDAQELERKKRKIELETQLALVGIDQESAKTRLIIVKAEEEKEKIAREYRDRRLQAISEEQQQERDLLRDGIEKSAQLELERIAKREELQRQEFEKIRENEERIRQLKEETLSAVENIQAAIANGDIEGLTNIAAQLVETFQDAGLKASDKFLAGLGGVAGAAAGILGEVAANIEVVDRESAERQRKLQIAQLIFAGISSAAQALFRSMAIFPPPAGQIIGGVQAALIGGITAVQVSKLKSEPLGFADGGFTGDGVGMPDSSGYKIAGFVHENEYVTPEWQLQSPQYAPLIAQLEQGRLRGYATGGFTGARAASVQVDNQVSVGREVLRAIESMPAPVVSVKEITGTARRIQVKQNIGSI